MVNKYKKTNFLYNKSLLNLELYYYYCFLLKISNFFINYKNLNNFFKIFTLMSYSKKNKNLLHFLNTLNSPLINKYLNYNIKHKIEIKDKFKYSDQRPILNFYYTKNNKSLDLKLFNLFYLFNYSLFNNQFKSNYNFRLFYIRDYSDNIAILDMAMFLARWKDCYDLIFNIFYYNLNPILLGSPVFKDETLALNWNYNHFDINLWRYYFPFFIFKANKYSRRVDFFFKKLSQYNITFYIITDCTYHYKNMHYISKKKIYSIGLINVNVNPWLVEYPIISFFDSYITQLFFYKLLIFINKQALFFKYNQFKNFWFNFILSNSLNKVK